MVPDGLKSASNSPEQIHAWATQTPNMNIAIATGNASNLVVFDLDVREIGDDIVDGEFELNSWLAAKGLELPTTLIQRTGSGGSHILLDWPNVSAVRPAISSRANWLPGVDIRADGGYIVAAPSIHYSGNRYQWESDTLGVIPAEFISILGSGNRESGAIGGVLGPATYSLDAQTLLQSGFRMGNRDDGFTRLAGVLRARGDSLETAKLIVRQVWDKTDQGEKTDYFPLAVALEKLERGYRNWAAPDDEITHEQMMWAVRADARARVRLTQQMPAIGPSSTITPPVNVTRTGTESTENEDEDEESDRDPTQPLDVMSFMLGGEVLRELPTMLTRNDGKCLIYAGRLHSIYGEPGHGKTWVSLALVKERLEAGETVAYLDYDEDDAGKSMAMRLTALGTSAQLVGDKLRYLNPQGLGRDQQAWAKLKAQIKLWKPSLVVVDTMAPALVELGLNEKDNAEVGAWYAHARWLLRGLKPQAALVIVDHVVKNGEGRGRWARGAGDKLGRLHAAYAVESDAPFSREVAGHINLVIAKDRGGEIGREGDTAATIKFTPSNGGQRLMIQIETPSQASLSELSTRNSFVDARIRQEIHNYVVSDLGGRTLTQIRQTVKGSITSRILNEMIESGMLYTEDDVESKAALYRVLPSE
jgi:hypothetical protein